MKKSLAIIICAFVVLTAAACGKSDTAKLTTDEIEQKIAGLLNEDYACDTDIDVQQLKDYYRLDMSKVKEYTAKESKIPSVIPDTVIVLRTDKNYVDTAVEMLNRALTGTVMSFGFGNPVTINARIYTSGEYVLYVIAERAYDGGTPEQQREAVNNTYAEIDKVLKESLDGLSDNLALIPENAGDTTYPYDEDMPILR